MRQIQMTLLGNGHTIEIQYFLNHKQIDSKQIEPNQLDAEVIAFKIWLSR